MEDDVRSLNELVSEYGEIKSVVDSYKKVIDSDNKLIKEKMRDLGIKEVSSGGYTAKYSESVSEGFDEEKLIKKLESMTYKEAGVVGAVSVAQGLGIIKMKPYVDMDALENAIYTGRVKASELADCKIVTRTPRLTISKVKGDK